MLAFQDFMGSCRHSAPHITLTPREPCRPAAPAVWYLPSRTTWSPHPWARLALMFSTEPSQLTRALQVRWFLWLRNLGRLAGKICWVSVTSWTRFDPAHEHIKFCWIYSWNVSPLHLLLQPHFYHPSLGAIMSPRPCKEPSNASLWVDSFMFTILLFMLL